MRGQRHVAISGQSGVMRFFVTGCGAWWAWQNSNLRPLPCQGRSARFAASPTSLSHSFFEYEAWPVFGQVNAKWPQVARGNRASITPAAGGATRG